MSNIAKPENLPAKFRVLKDGTGLTRRLPFVSDDIPTHGVTFAKWLTGHAVIDPAGKWLAVTGDVSPAVVAYLAKVAFGTRKTVTDAYTVDGEPVGSFVAVVAKGGK